MTRANKLMPVAGVPPKIGRLGRFVLRLRPLSRRFHAYCIGTSKSGTPSVAEIFGRRYRAAHEPGVEQLIDMMLAASSGKASQSQLVEFVRSRDSRLRLELECSHPLFHFLAVLSGDFPEAGFIPPTGDSISGLDSSLKSQWPSIEPNHCRNFGESRNLAASG